MKWLGASVITLGLAFWWSLMALEGGATLARHEWPSLKDRTVWTPEAIVRASEPLTVSSESANRARQQYGGVLHYAISTAAYFVPMAGPSEARQR